MGHMQTGCQHHCDAQKLAAFGESTFPMGHASVHDHQPAQLTPHFIVAEQAHIAKFLPITCKSEQTWGNSNTCEGSIKLEQSELSAEPAPSVELAHAVEKVSQDTKVCDCCILAFVVVLFDSSSLRDVLSASASIQAAQHGVCLYSQALKRRLAGPLPTRATPMHQT